MTPLKGGLSSGLYRYILELQSHDLSRNEGVEISCRNDFNVDVVFNIYFRN